MKRFWTALNFLTTLPSPLHDPSGIEQLGNAAVWFPLIGAFLGGLVALIYTGLERLFPAWIGAVLSAAAWVYLTGGLHLDGLADSFDGLFHASSPERRLEIMQDPRLGTFGTVGLILTILVKISALAVLSIPLAWLVVPLAAATARWLLLWAARQPMARPGGTAAMFSQGIKPMDVVVSALVPFVLAILGGWRGLLALLLACIVALGIFRLARARLGGLTGDVFGFMVETVEVVILLVFVAQV